MQKYVFYILVRMNKNKTHAHTIPQTHTQTHTHKHEASITVRGFRMGGGGVQNDSTVYFFQFFKLCSSSPDYHSVILITNS